MTIQTILINLLPVFNNSTSPHPLSFMPVFKEKNSQVSLRYFQKIMASSYSVYFLKTSNTLKTFYIIKSLKFVDDTHFPKLRNFKDFFFIKAILLITERWISINKITNCLWQISHFKVNLTLLLFKYKPSCRILKNSLFILHSLVNNFWCNLHIWWLLCYIFRK